MKENLEHISTVRTCRVLCVKAPETDRVGRGVLNAVMDNF